MRAVQLTTLAGLFAAPALAWWTDIHQQIGYTAEEFLTEETKEILTKILEPEAEGSLGRVSGWADEHRREDGGGHTTTWHWINPADEPPRFCNIYLNRDCTADGCIVAALANETQILKDCIKDVKLGNDVEDKCAHAAKFVTHFSQDMAQPMHNTGQARGGNDIDVVFDGEETNLHAIWDGPIVYAHAGDNITSFGNESIDPFFSKVADRIRADDYFIPKSEWIACTNPGTPMACPLEWARDTNQWNCDYAFSQIYEGEDLATSGYAKGAGPIVEIQIAKAALRLATWMNKLVENCFHEREVILDLHPSWVGGPNEGN